MRLCVCLPELEPCSFQTPLCTRLSGQSCKRKWVAAARIVHNTSEVRTTMDSAVEIQDRNLKLTNLEKVLYPVAGFTKKDVIDYYARTVAVVIPHLAGR